MDRIEFDALSSKMKELEAEVESLKNKTLCLLVSFVVILIFASFSVMNIIRQYSTIHDYYMDSQRIDREIGQSLNELIQKIEELQSKSEQTWLVILWNLCMWIQNNRWNRSIFPVFDFVPVLLAAWIHNTVVQLPETFSRDIHFG